MSTRQRNIFSIVLILITICALPVNANAGEETAEDYFRNMGVQFGRGLWNIVSSPAEIPCTISDDMHENAGTGFFTGFGKGLAFMLRRILIGGSEVITFMLPRAEASIPVVCTQAQPS